MWTYKITDGTMTHDDPQHGRTCFSGYSGAGHTLAEGRNNPDMQDAIAKGPLPVGSYTIGVPHTSAHTGPYTMDLTPNPGNDMHGRSLFRIHGNNAANDASEGCIILPPDARRAVWESGDHALDVIV